MTLKTKLLDLLQVIHLYISILLYPQVLPLHDTGPAQEYWLRKPEPLNLLSCKPAPVDTRLQVNINLNFSIYSAVNLLQ